MDDRYGGRISRQAMSLNDFYNRQFGNVYVFGGTDLRYRTRVLGKHISKMYESRIPTVVFYNAPYNSNQQRILNNLFLYIKKKYNDHQNRLIFIDNLYPYYHPLYGMSLNDIIRTIDYNHELLKDDMAFLEGILNIIEAEKQTLKLHSILEYAHYDLTTLIHKCDYLLATVKDRYMLARLEQAKKNFEDEALTSLSAVPVRKLLNHMNFKISNLTSPYCHYSITQSVKEQQIICINLAGHTSDLMDYMQAEMSSIAQDYRVFLFDVNCSMNELFEKMIVNHSHVSIYSDNFNRDFSSIHQSAILGKSNITLLFQMQAGSAMPIVDYYGQHNYVYTLKNKGHTHTNFDIFHLRNTHYGGTQQHRERVNRLSGENVAGLLPHFQCFEVRDNDIIFHSNVSYEGLL